MNSSNSRYLQQSYDARNSLENFVSKGRKTFVKINGKLHKTITPTVNVHFINIVTKKEKYSSYGAENFYKYMSKHKIDLDSVAVTHAEVFLVDKVTSLDSQEIWLYKFREHVYWSVGLDINGSNMTVTRTEREIPFNLDMGRGTRIMEEYGAQALFERIDITVWHR